MRRGRQELELLALTMQSMLQLRWQLLSTLRQSNLALREEWFRSTESKRTQEVR
jgi:hypothetical protein